MTDEDHDVPFATGDPRPAAGWERVQALLLSIEGVDAFLVELAGLGAAAIDPAASCGITTRYDGRPITVASSDERAAALDETQYVSVGGPCLHALETGRTVYVPDVANDPRWPEFVEFAAGLGLRCSLSIPLIVAGASVGAMNFYAFHDRMAFDLAHQTAAATFAAQASGALQLVTRNARNVELVRHLEQALTSRSVIDQAMGIVMAQTGSTADEAFEVLRRRSQQDQRRLRDLAAQVVADVTGSQPSDGGRFRHP